MDDHADTLNKLSHEITRLITRVDYHEKEIATAQAINESRFLKLESKIDALAETVTNQIRSLTDKVAELNTHQVAMISKATVASGLILGFVGIIARHFGWW